MPLSRRKRIVLILVLLSALCSLFIWDGIDQPPAPELGAYPGAEDIVQQPDRYHNHSVSVGGTVVSTNPVVIQDEYDTDTGTATIRLQITGIEKTVDSGDHLQVFGILTDSRTVQATNTVVVPQTGLWYAWGISFIAGLWALGRIISHWRIDITKTAFVPRTNQWRPWRREDD